MKKCLFLIVLSCMFSSISQAQLNDFSIWQISLGGANQYEPGLETAFQMPQRFGSTYSLNKTAIYLGAKYLRRKNRILYGDNAFLLVHSSNKWPDLGSKTTLSANLFNLGYIVHNGKKSFIYFLGGAGYGTVNMKVHNQTGNPSINMDNKNSINPGESKKYYFDNPLFEGSIGFKKGFINLNADKKNRNGFIIGLDAGYVALPFKSRWHIKGSSEELSGFPKYASGVFYLKLNLGLITINQ